MKKFFEKNGGDWPVIAQGNGHFALDYGVVKLPESYLVAPDGTVVDEVRRRGPADAGRRRSSRKLSGASK